MQAAVNIPFVVTGCGGRVVYALHTHIHIYIYTRIGSNGVAAIPATGSRGLFSYQGRRIERAGVTYSFPPPRVVVVTTS